MRFTIRAKVLTLALGLALPPLLLLSLLGLNSLDRARDSAVQSGTAVLREQAENNLRTHAADKAALYNAALSNIGQQVESVAGYARTLIDAGAPPPTNQTTRVWVVPGGPSPANLKAHAAAVARAGQFVPLLQSVVARNRLVSLGYIGLEDGGALATNTDIVDMLDATFDPRQRSWYIAARDAKQTVWVDTYVDAVTKQLATTCATPLYDSNGNFIGVVGFDLLLGTIQEDLLKLDEGQAGYAFLINEKGKVLVKPQMSAAGVAWNQPFEAENLLLSSDVRLREVIQRMTKRKDGIARLFFEGGDVYLAYAPIASSGWSVGIVIPEAEIIRPAQEAGASIAIRQEELRTQVVLLLGSALVLIVGLGIYLSKRLAKPLRQLQVGAQRIAYGDLNHQLPESIQDEIGDVMRSFNLMAAALREKIAELEDNLRRLAILNEASNNFRSILSLPQLLQAVPDGVCAHLGFERAVLYLLEGRTLRAVSASFGTDADQQVNQFLAAANTIPITADSETVEADILRTRQAVIVDNPWNHPRVIQTKQAISRSESYVQVPIFGREEQIVGIISADYYYSRRPITARDAAQLLTYASMAGLSIENTRLYSELERQVAERTTELRAALVRAQEADKLKGQFLAAISHELRTPLNAIIGFSTVMLDELDGPISSLQREDLKTINRNGRFLLHLINELLDLARIEAGRLELDIKPLDVALLIDDVAETVQGLLHNRQIVLKINLPPKLPRARADAAKIRQVVLNLLANAVKFTDTGAITISAQCVVMAGDKNEPPPDQPAIIRDGRRIVPYIAISVRDTGIGIAPEHIPLIFEEFRQVHEASPDRRGSGLGLSICRRIVEAHQGRIWAESTVGQGSVFTFTIPCHLEARRELPETDQPTEHEHNGTRAWVADVV
ncbi:MAG: ATP-binding protein [Roseiflexaceae bacterium]|nr:ATP-binding protein [Roseiflexaceae bacterium]